MKRFLVLLTLAIAATLIGQSSLIAKVDSQASNLLIPEEHHPRLSLIIANKLQHIHYRKLPINDELSERIYDTYLKSLDPGKFYFTQEDLDEFAVFRTRLDDSIRRGNLDAAYLIYNRYQQRMQAQLEFAIDLLSNKFDSFDFTRDERIMIDREKASPASDQAALDDLWRKRLKNSIIGHKLNGKSDEEIQELMTKRYTNQLNRLQQTQSEDAFHAYMNALSENYDPHTTYFSPRLSENFNIQMRLSLQGIGAMLQSEDEHTVVKRLIPAGPADKANELKAGDRIVGVGQGLDGDVVDVVGWRLDDVVDLIRGEKGSIVRLSIIPNTAKDETQTRLIQITRDEVKLEEQSAQKKVIEIERADKKHKFGIIDIPTFYSDFEAAQRGDTDYRSTTRDVTRLINELKTEGMDGLIIDLRYNGGGSLQEVSSLVGLFINQGPTVQVKVSSGDIEQLYDTDSGVIYDGPLIVMVNRLSASASEIFAGAIQDYNRGLVVGTQTFGKGTVQGLQSLGRGQLKLTHAKFYRVSGNSTQNLGVVPDIEFPALYDKDEIGESSLPNALLWDRVSASEYDSYPDFSRMIPQLAIQHQERTASQTDFTYLTSVIDYWQAQKNLTHVSLKLSERERQYEEDLSTQLALENQHRVAKGMPLLKSFDDLEDNPLGKSLMDEGDDLESKDKAASESPFLQESAEILLDYIELSGPQFAKH